MAEYRNVKILMLPYLATGHITPFLELAKRLSDRGFSIDLCSTPINLSFIKKRVTQKYTSSIHLVEFHLPNLPQLPPHQHTTNGLLPHQKPLLQKALRMAKPQFCQILEDQKPDLLIYDTVGLLWAGGVASTLNIPAIKFYVVNAAAFCFLNHFYFNPGVEFPFPALYIHDYEKQKVTTNVVEQAEEDVDRGSFSECDMIVLVDSSRAVDAKYMDYVSETGHLKIVPIGALFVQQEVVKNQDGDGDTEETELMKWLGKKKEHSTLYVSFGSEYYLTKEEIEEVAYGLERSDVDFIWSVRFAKGEVLKLEEVLPRGFLERIGEKGRIVEGWAPQVRILKHPSIGAFVSHCGWNSILEGIQFAVPIIAMPMIYDQPVVARLLVEIGVAVEVARDENGKLHRAKIAEAIKDVIGEEKGESLRREVNSLRENITLRGHEEMDGVVEVIKHFCNKSQPLT